MKLIKLTRGKFAKVDDEDFAVLNKHRWYCISAGYAVRSQWVSYKKYKCIYMHNLINRTPVGKHTDHINNDKLDNRKENLRTASASQNLVNSKLRKDNTSGFRGVNWLKTNMTWRVRVIVNGKEINGGFFKEKPLAVQARNKLARRYYGNFAKIGIL